jgi:hypothetical protein
VISERPEVTKRDGAHRLENNSVLKIEPRAPTTGRQPPLVNHRSSVNRLTESGSHQTAPSANQSAIFAFSVNKSKIARMFVHFLLPEGTGEA